jgi:hypothetical protein
MTDLIDTKIDAAHRKAADAEVEARSIVERMGRIPGLERFLASSRREFGAIPNPYKGEGGGNLTAQALLELHDAPLAQFLAQQVGRAISAPNYEAQAAAEERQQQVQRMQQATAELQARNANARLQRERADLAGVNHITGRRF